MAKNQIKFVCSQCGYQALKWLGVCPECQAWATLEEKIIPVAGSIGAGTKTSSAHLKPVVGINQIGIIATDRLKSLVNEWDRVMGGGIMPASLIVLTGDPGIGKSTLLVQIAAKISLNHKVIYFSTEESLSQIKQRINRLALEDTELLFCEENSFEAISQILIEQQPKMAIIDSIQSCFLDLGHSQIPGSVAQLKEIAFRLMELAKTHQIAIIMTGHITKDGTMAGPKILEHMVDAVFYLNGEETFGNRILTATKNRFGAAGEIGFFQMQHNGLEPVQDINQKMLQESSQSPGSCLAMLSQGSRPVVIEFQALCVRSKFGQPQRIITGADYKRVVLIAAILEKNLKMAFSAHDLFFKISGGIWANESSGDLAIALALISSYLSQPLPKNNLALGELSLTGKIKTNPKELSLASQLYSIGISCIIAGKNELKINSKELVVAENVFQLLQLFPHQTGKAEEL